MASRRLPVLAYSFGHQVPLGPQQLWGQSPHAFSTAAKSAADYRDSFLSPPHSLEAERDEVQYPSALEGNALGRALLTVIGAYSRKQQLNNGALVLYQAITEQAESKDLAQAVGLDPTAFMSTFNLLSLHVWLVLNRIKAEEPKEAKQFRQLLYTHYFYRDFERRVRQEIPVNSGKWIKKLEQVFYSSSLAYDMALAGENPELVPGQEQVVQQQGSPHLAFRAALVRNVYKGELDKTPFAELLARYLQREQQNLQLTPLEAIYRGQVRFSQDFKSCK